MKSGGWPAPPGGLVDVLPSELVKMRDNLRAALLLGADSITYAMHSPDGRSGFLDLTRKQATNLIRTLDNEIEQRMPGR